MSITLLIAANRVMLQ